MIVRNGRQYIKPFDLFRQFNKIPYKAVSDNMIRECIRNKDFADLTKEHKGPVTYTKDHAKRIATLVDMIEKGKELDPIFLLIYGDNIVMEDGYHRFRAYLYTGKLVHVDVKVFKK